MLSAFRNTLFWGNFLVFVCLFTIGSYAQSISNKGKDFWLGYGNHDDDFSQNRSQSMNLYITSTSATKGKVEIPGISFVQEFEVKANDITTVAIPDAAKLKDEGKFNTGIHITAERSVVVYAHIFNASVSGATLVLPTASLGKEYYSINYKQSSNSANGFSYFFVVATEDGTEVEIKPSANSKGGLKKDVPVNIKLDKGGIYQVLSSTDLTGSYVRSVTTTSNACKRIAVFSGSGKIAIGCNPQQRTSDNAIQQVYPKTAWGKEYVTIPFKSRNYDEIRIVKSDPSAKVTLNGVLLSDNLFTNDYYDFSSTDVNYIKSDLPVQVVQYAVTQGSSLNCTNDPTDVGDPEIIYLNSIEQSIQRITMYSSPKYQIHTDKHFINVVIPTSAVVSFKLDGLALTTGFSPVPSLPGYSYNQLNVSAGVHNLTADEGFNAIAYGFGGAESYGYSAGVSVNTLGIEAKSTTTSNTVPAGCVSGTFNFNVWVSYKPVKLSWVFDDGTLPVDDTNPVSVSSTEVNGIKYYLYSYQGPPKTFSLAKDYSITVTATKLSQDACGSEDVIETNFTVYDNFNVKFKANTVCEGEETIFTDESDLKDAEVKKWEWDFGDGSPISSEQNPRHIFKTPGMHLVKLRLETLYGCDGATITDTVIVYGKPKSKFQTSGSCVGKPVTFINQSSAVDSAIVKWIWIYGDGKIDTLTTNASPIHIYETPKTGYQAQLKTISSTGCESASSVQVNIYPIPVPDFVLPESCVNDVVRFVNTSRIDGNSSQQNWAYHWDFGDTTSISDVSSSRDGSYKFSSAGSYQVSLTVKSENGCDSTITKTFTVNGSDPKALFTVPNENALFSDTPISFINQSFMDLDGIGMVTKVQWFFTDNLNNVSDTVDNEPEPGKVLVKSYPLHHDLQAREYKIRLIAHSGESCKSEVFEKIIKVNGVPKLAALADTSICMENGSIRVKPPQELAGFQLEKEFFRGTGISENGSFNPYSAGVGIHTITYTYVATNGGSSSITTNIEVFPTPEIQVPEEMTIDDGESVQLYAITSPLATHYEWSPRIGLNNSEIANPVAKPTETTRYTVSVKSEYGCVEHASVRVKVLKKLIVPNAFSPNNDGVNDTWEIKYLADYENFSVNIFSRLGLKVYGSNGYYEPWNGKNNGQDLPGGVYYYIIEPRNGKKPITGYVTILR